LFAGCDGLHLVRALQAPLNNAAFC
jgi:hypothetical protein